MHPNNSACRHFHLFVLADIYRKHGSKYSCGEPTSDTSHRPLYPAVPADLEKVALHADGSSGMRC